ncbi:MAG TPA: NrsF family protein [Reyranella sp.]|jgi:hypothetical protein|nr:NrsF family protein [Reyranella sp.]
MKTDQLVDALVADGGAASPIARLLLLALAAGVALSLVVFFLTLGIRPDIGPALETWRFDLKIVTALLGLVLAFGVCRDCARPDMPPHPLRRLLPLLALIVLAVAVELVLVPEAAWRQRLIGSNSLICLPMVPILSLAPLAVVLWMLRRAAPASPALAGAAAGFMAALSGATLYAFHCFDDSPLFVATWYSLAVLGMTAVGAWLGPKLLRW